ncbi:predicted protein [Aspergillus terreus NIH2624]|uniref:MOSC domain-containing protein n=1 Tax=Aspergillus terreus (strain NIH 2624 / FGSC A1156) TaxID=341663 RepID=Q0CJT0_ASPTN|nr:uncharacterized protein ATEG_06054 [Aspergillus terreus NIH2624]EAU33815.1 predicted protein [Aspergillus terreus NIH2624]
MTDQYDPKYNIPEDTVPDGPIRVKAIYIHPVKSCGPVEMHRALLTKTGFLYDRCFAFATEITDATGSKWRFISQRTKPIMSQIKTELWLPHDKTNVHDPLVQAGGCVVLTFQDPEPPSWTARLETILHTWDLSSKPQTTLIVPLQPTPAQTSRFQIRLRTFGIHSRDAQGLDLGTVPSIAAALPKLKTFLGIPLTQPLTLLRCTPDTLTRTDRNLAPLSHIGTPSVHGYTDQQPVHINSLASVHSVSSLLPPENRPLNALRFRANLWIFGAPAFDEESWKRYRILPRTGGGPRAEVNPTLCVVCRTSRCTMPNVDPDRGVFDADSPAPGKKRGRPQPSTTLVRYRTVEEGNPAALGYLGMHCVPEDRGLEEARGQGVGLYVQVGDEIEVLERGVHLYGSTGGDY